LSEYTRSLEKKKKRKEKTDFRFVKLKDK